MSELFREALRRYMAGNSEWDAVLKRNHARGKALGIKNETDVERLSDEYRRNKITKVGQIAGCRVTDGLIKRGAQARLLRDGTEIWKGKIASLKRFKDDAAEVREGVECGIDLAGHKDIHVGDIIETFTTEKMADELGENTAALKKQQLAELAAAKAAEKTIEAAEATLVN